MSRIDSPWLRRLICIGRLLMPSTLSARDEGFRDVSHRKYRLPWACALVLAGLSFSAPAMADYWFEVIDTSQLKYLVASDSHVYLRNLNQFDSTVLGCCYNYWIDVSTTSGQAMWATLLAKIQTQQSIWIFVSSQTAPGSVYLGDL